MKKLVLHVGMHKTGSSSIQKTLSGYDDGRIRYADLKRDNHSVPIYCIFSEARYRKRFFRQRGIGRKEIDKMAADFRQLLIREMECDRETLIISGEDICFIPEHELWDMKAFLNTYCDDVRILGYVRDPIGFASSQFQQLVKFDTDEIRIPSPEYRSRFKKFFDVFGGDAVTLRPFDRALLKDGSVVRDMMDICGIENANVPEQNTNEGLSDTATRLLFHFNRFGPVTTGCRQAMESRKVFVDLLGKIFPGPSYRFPPEIFTTEHTDLSDLGWLRDAAGIDFTKKSGEPVAEACSVALTDIDKQDPNALMRLRQVLQARGIKTREDATLTDALSFLFYDVLAQGWKSRTAKRQARKRARRRALKAAAQ